MTLSVEERIDAQEQWTFRECLGLAAEFNLKTRMVVVMVLARGKNYVEKVSVEQASPTNDLK